MMLEATVRRITGRTIHRQAEIVSGRLVAGEQSSPPARVRIEPTDGGFLLLYLNASGECLADTWHVSVTNAKAQAKFEFEIDESDWVDTGQNVP
jgi:hypothetical protein